MKHRVFVILSLGLTAGACRPAADQQPPPVPQQVVAWRAVGSWSGHGNKQTESFTSESGALRVRWTTTGTRSPGRAGAFRVTAHSAISGRLLEQVADHAGAGSGVGYVNQDPHVFYLMVESDHLDWTLWVEEAFAGTVSGR